MRSDITTLTRWEMARSPSGSLAGPEDLASVSLDWLPFEAPGTAAAALRAAGAWGFEDQIDFDADDWWFRTAFTTDLPGATELRVGGLATICDLWCNAEIVLHSESMYREHQVLVELNSHNEFVLVCRSLAQHLTARRPRGRWKTRIVELQQLRWVRTTMLGRMPGWTPAAAAVGPWRPIELHPAVNPSVASLRCWTENDGDDWRVVIEGLLVGMGPTAPAAQLQVGTHSCAVGIERHAGGWLVSGSLAVLGASTWMPHTHGSPSTYDVSLTVGPGTDTEFRHRLGPIGFRTITTGSADDGFSLEVNGVRVFCRGACWMPPDPVSLNCSGEALRAALLQVVHAGMNMVRVTGTTVYESDDFYTLCDELGILVWQDFMFANMDYPVVDEAFAAEVAVEAEQLLVRLRPHPSIAVLCGGSEIEQQAAMMGLGHEDYINELGRSVLAKAVEQHLPDCVYVPCSPSGGTFPFSPSEGVAHYYGVGAYLRPLEDARRAGVRFASECLAFANVPCRQTVDELLLAGDRPTHSPRWKSRVPRDRGVGWDFDDVRDHYVQQFFSIEPTTVRYADPDRYLDLGRAATCIAIESTLSEWRRPASGCSGALLLQLRDPWQGAGWGLVDASGRPKSSYHAVARACAPLAVLLTDEGLNGLAATIVNDAPSAFVGELRARLFNSAGAPLESNVVAVEIEPFGSLVQSVDAVIGAFRDLTYSYRFGPPSVDVVAVDLFDVDGRSVARAHHLPSGHVRPTLHDIGLTATARLLDDTIEVHVESRQFAHFVSIDLPGWLPDDDWFHLAPGDGATVLCRGGSGRRSQRGEVRALNVSGARSLSILPEARQ